MGLFPLPGTVLEDGEPREIEAFLVMDVATGQVLLADSCIRGQALETMPLALRRAVKMHGEAPLLARVADPALAAVVTQNLPRTRVVVAPTPELDPAVASLVEHLEGGETGRSPEFPEGLDDEGVAILGTLFRTRPWEIFPPDRPAFVHAPSMGLNHACVAVMGHMEEEFGFSLYPSKAHYDQMITAKEMYDQQRKLDIPAHVAVSFEGVIEAPPDDDLPATELPWSLTGPWTPPSFWAFEGAASREVTPTELHQLMFVAVALMCSASVYQRVRLAVENDEPWSLDFTFGEHRGTISLERTEKRAAPKKARRTPQKRK